MIAKRTDALAAKIDADNKATMEHLTRRQMERGLRCESLGECRREVCQSSGRPGTASGRESAKKWHICNCRFKRSGRIWRINMRF